MQKGPMSTRRLTAVRQRAQRTLLWQVWDRCLRSSSSIAVSRRAGKAFVSFFPFVIVVSAFMSKGVRDAILRR